MANVNDNEETACTGNSRLENQPIQPNEMRDDLIPERVIEQVSPESNRPVRNRKPPERLSYYAPGQSVLNSNVHSVNKAPHIPVFSNIVSSIRRCIPSYRSQPSSVIYMV